MIQKKVFKHLNKVPQIYQCLVCHQIPKDPYNDSDCGGLTCSTCREIKRASICDCKNITLIDYITHKTLQQIQIKCHLCLFNIDYYKFNKHLKNCQIFQTQRAEIQNLQQITNDNFSEKQVCKICELQHNIICQYCQNKYCIQCKENIVKIQDNSFECNYCCGKINNFINHLQQCQMLIVNCEFCQQDYLREKYLVHLELCLSKKQISLELERKNQIQIIELQRVYIRQASRNYFQNQFYEIIYDRIAREDETLSVN